MVGLLNGAKNFEDICNHYRIPTCDRRTDRHLSTA